MPGRYKLEGYGTYEIDSDDDAEIQSTISEIIAHEKAARASRPALGGPTGLASKRLAALGGKPESEKGDFAPQPRPREVEQTSVEVGPTRKSPVTTLSPPPSRGPSLSSALLTPELQRAASRITSPAMEPPEIAATAQGVRDRRIAGAQRRGRYLAPLAAVGSEMFGGAGEMAPDATPVRPGVPLFAGKGLGQAPVTRRAPGAGDAALAAVSGGISSSPPLERLKSDYDRVHGWAQGASDDLGRWATKDTEHSALARLIDAGEQSDSKIAQTAAAITQGATQAGASSLPALAEFGILHRTTPAAMKPLVDAAMASYFGGEGVGGLTHDVPAIAQEMNPETPPLSFDERANLYGKTAMDALMGAAPFGARRHIADSLEARRTPLKVEEPGSRAYQPEYGEDGGPDFRAPEDVMAAARGDAHPLQQIRRGEYAPPPQPPPFVSGPEGQARGPFQVPPDVQAQAGVPPADLRARTGNTQRPAPPVDPEAARVLASILSGGEELPPAPALQVRPPLPTVGDAPSWQDRQRAERASPAKPPAEENIQVEPKATTDAQLAMVDEGQGQPGKKPGVLYTVQGGAKPPDVVPEGLARVDGPAGTLIFDPSKVTPEQAREALTSGEGLDKALGFSGPRPEPHPDNAVVSVLGKDGVEKSSQVAGPGDVEGAVKAAQGMAGEGDQVAVRTPDEVIADRQAGIEAEKAGRGPTPPEPSAAAPDRAQVIADAIYAPKGGAAQPAAVDLVRRVLAGDRRGGARQAAEDKILAMDRKLGDKTAPIQPAPPAAREDGVTARTGKGPSRKTAETPAPADARFTVEPTTEIEFADGWWYPEGRKRSDSHPTGETRTRWYLYEDGENVGKYDSAHEANFAIKERQRLAPPGASRTEAVEAAPKGDAPPEPGVRPAAEPVAAGRKALLDERAASIEERRELQRKIREDSLSPKKLARAKEELHETELHLKALDKKLGYEAGGPTAAQVEADLKERFGDRYEPDAPEPVEAPAAEAPKGKPARVWVSPTEPLDVEYRIVEADTVHASHDVNGLPNPNYKGHQPRGRDRSEAIGQMKKIAEGPNHEILMESPGVAEGAPVAREDGSSLHVESGSGRTAGVQEAYRRGTAERYRAGMVENAEKYGESPESVSAMQKPMLVRVRRAVLTPEEQKRFTQDANKPVGLQMSTSETASVDADRLTPETMALFNPSDTGDLMAASNRPFIDRFMEDVVTPEERGALVTRDGMVSPEGVRRIQNAVVTKAYGSGRMVERALEGGAKTDAVLAKNVVTGLMRAASSVAKSRAMVDAGEAHDVGFLGPIEEAVAKLAELRRDGQSVADYLDQSDMFGDPLTPEGRQVLSIFEANGRAPNKVAAYISAVARAIEGSGRPGLAEKPTLADVYSAARNDYEAKHGEQGDLFGRAEPVSPQALPSAGGEGARSLFDSGPDGGDGPGGSGGAPGGGRPGGGEPGGKPRVFAYSSGKGVGRDPYAERTGRQAVPVPTFKRHPRTPPVRPPEGPLEVLKAESLVPAYARLKNGGQEMLDDIHEVFSATTVSDSAKRTADIKRKNYAQRDFRMARLDTALRPPRDYFDKLRPADRMKAAVDFIGTFERQDPKDPKNSPKQATPELEKHAALLRAILDASWREVEEYGYDGSASYLKNYFPRIFKKPDAAARFAHEWYERRSAEGSKGFLHKRYYELLDDALATGLKLADDNPADIVKNHVAQVQQYLMWQKEKGQSIRERIWRYKPVDMPMPEGYDIVHPEKGVVYGDPSVAVGEAVTKRFRLMEDIAKELNIPHERLAGVGGEFGRTEFGGEAGEGRVVTRFGTPVGVLAHEVGHVLDQRYKLWDALMSGDGSPTIRRELRDLADLRYESKPTVSDAYKQYVRTADEQIANMLDAYVSEPGLMRELAPVTLGEFRKFLLDKPELHKFFDMQPGLELEERVTRVPVKGKVIIGHWIAPRPVVRLIDRSLTPGLQNKLWYRTFRGLTNVMNQIQLGMSGFHAVFTGLDAITSQVSLALEEAAHGEYWNALKHGNPISAALAPLSMLKEGKRIRDMAKAVAVGDSFESMPAEVQNLLRAGGAITQDVRYSTGQVDAMKRAWNRGNPIFAAGRLPGAFLETMAKPIMEHWVPAIKIGMFAREAEFVLRRLGPDATGAEISHHLGRIWDSVENRMGQLRYDNLLWDRTMKDLGQVAVRSLGWNLGDIREIGGGIFDAGRTGARSVKNAEVEAKKTAARGEIRKAEGALAQAQQGGKPAEIEKAEAALRRAQAAMPSNLNDPVFTRRMAYSLAMPITVGTMGAIYYYGKHGKLPANIKDAFAIPTGGRNKDGSEERVFLPTYAKDVYAWAKDPFTTATHKLSPGVSIGAEIAKNQDYWGTQIREGNGAEQVRDSVEHAIRQMVPMSFRQILQSKFPGSNIGSGEALMGVTKAPASLSRSAAEEKLNEYLHRTSGGIKTKAEAEKSKARSEIKALIRGGHDEAADAAIEKAIEEHQVSPDEKQGRRALYKAAAKTVLENTLRSMPVDEALEVYRAATTEERQRWADAFQARIFGSASRRPSWWKDRPQEEVEAIQAEAEKLLPPE